MKRWAILTVALYAVILLLLTVPLFLAYGFKWSLHAPPHVAMTVSLTDAFDLYREWGYWVWLGVMVLGQALLLFVPVRIAERRLTARRHVLVPVITAAFLLANVVLGAVFAVASAVFGDKAGGIFELFGNGNAAIELLNVAFFPVLLWVIWGFVFYRSSKTLDADSLTKHLTRRLLRGSILELLVAVPSHIIVRGRDDCCAPMGSFWGIVTGLTVMLLSFGPGVFFLFVERMARLRPKSPEDPNPS
ncbi:MAG TPA: hypothetical protein VGK40_04810 [Verrucomicrobiae bacterium]|jgi:hypothetical protein